MLGVWLRKIHEAVFNKLQVRQSTDKGDSEESSISLPQIQSKVFWQNETYQTVQCTQIYFNMIPSTNVTHLGWEIRKMKN